MLRADVEKQSLTVRGSEEFAFFAMIFTFYPRNTVPTPSEVFEGSWSEFLAHPLMCKIDRSCTRREDLPMYSPARLKPGRTRSKGSVADVQAAVFDLDHKSGDIIEQIVSPLIDQGYAYLLHSTFRNHEELAKTGLWRMRLIVPLSRPIPAEQWPAYWRALNKMFALGETDQQTKDAARAFWVPAAPPDAPEEHILLDSSNGRAIDVDALVLEPDEQDTTISLPNKKLTVKHIQEKCEELSKRRKQKAFREQLRTLLAGDVLAEEGERHNAVLELTWQMVHEWPDASARSIADLFVPSLRLMGDGAPTPDDVMGMVTSAQQKTQEERIAAINEYRKAKEQEISNVSQDARTTPYTSEEVEGFAKALDTTVEKLRRQLIVQVGNQYYVFYNGTYRSHAFSKDDAFNGVKKWLAPIQEAFQLEFYEYSDRGRRTHKSLTQLVDEYGQVADRVIYDLRAQRTYYDAKQHALIFASAPLRFFPPIFSERVDQWLRKLGGSKYDELQNWIASITRLDQPNSILYLHGVKGTGKSMLSEGLSRLYLRESDDPSETKIVELETAMSRFNFNMTRSPILFSDERVPVDFKGRARTDEILAIVTRRTHTIEAKHQQDTELRGCVRIIIAANAPDLLYSNGAITPEAIGALSDRVFQVHTDKEAHEFMQSLSDQEKKELVAAIPYHAMWLIQNRVFEPGPRFLVTGSPESVRAMLTGTGVRDVVCQWLVQYVLGDKEDAPHTEGKYFFRIHEGRLLVASIGLTKFWDKYKVSAPLPTPGALQRALSALSEEERKEVVENGRRQQYRVVVTNNLIAWAERNDWASKEQIEARLKNGV